MQKKTNRFFGAIQTKLGLIVVMAVCLFSINNFADIYTNSITLDTMAQTVNGRTMVPLKFVAEALGKEVIWNGESNPQTVTIKDASTTIVMSKDKSSNVFSKNVLVNGKIITVDVPGQVIDGRTCVPVKFISENTGCTVDYYSDTRQVTILEPSSDGKVIVLTLGSKEARVMKNTLEASLRRMATRLTSNSRTEVLNLIYNASENFDQSIVFIDSSSRAQISILSNRLVGDHDGIMTQANFKSNYDTLNLDSNTLAYQTDKLYFFKNNNYKQINIASLKSTEIETITSNTDILISFTNGATILTNTANEKYNFTTNKWEAPAIIRTEAEKKLIEAVKPYIAAGEFINTATFTNYVEAGKNGAIRVYSTSKPSATEKALFEKFENSGTSKAEFCDGTNIIGINGVDQSAKFNTNLIKDTHIDKELNGLYLNLKYDITIKKLVSFTESTGRVLQEFNPSTNKLDCLDPFRNLYTPEQYKQKTEQVLSNDINYPTFNFAGKYDSKIWLNDASGKPAFCLLVGGSVGTSIDRVQYYQKAVSRLNQIDPNFVKNMRDANGVQIICIQEKVIATSGAIYYRGGLGIIELNESDGYSGKAIKSGNERSIIGIYVVESRGLENYDYVILNQSFKRKNNMPYINNASIDKQAFAVRQYEMWADIPQNLRANLDGKTQIDLMKYYDNINNLINERCPVNGYTDYNVANFGKMSPGEFNLGISNNANSYNSYLITPPKF